MKTQKGFAQVLLLMGAAIIIISIIGGLYSLNKDKFSKSNPLKTTPQDSDPSKFFKIISMKLSPATQKQEKPIATPTTKEGKAPILSPTASPTPKPTNTPVPEEKKSPTSFPTASPTPKPTEIIPQPTPINCIEPTNYPSAPNGGMTYANWYFYKPDINSITNAFFIYNDPGITSDLYLQLYDGKIDDTSYYFGIQTTHVVIFSRFGTNDSSNVRTSSSAYKLVGTNEGDFVSLRLEYDIGTGGYATRLKRAEFDGTGDWFDLYIAKNSNLDSMIYVGGIRFPRKNSQTPAAFRDGGGTWTEFWDNNRSQLSPVPLWHIGLLPPIANEQWSPQAVNTSYSSMPNSDIYYDKKDHVLHMTIGASTPRCYPGTWITL